MLNAKFFLSGKKNFHFESVSVLSIFRPKIIVIFKNKSLQFESFSNFLEEDDHGTMTLLNTLMFVNNLWFAHILLSLFLTLIDFIFRAEVTELQVRLSSLIFQYKCSSIITDKNVLLRNI